MLAESFSQDDPLAHSQNISKDDFYAFIDGLYDQFVTGQLSYVAITKHNQKVAAVVLAKPYQHLMGEEGSDAIAALINSARQHYFSDYTPDANELVHIHFVASATDYRRQHLVQTLVKKVLANGIQQGYKRAIVEASGIRSRTLFSEHLQFTPQAVIDYASFQWQGTYPFTSIAEHTGITLMDKHIDTIDWVQYT